MPKISLDTLSVADQNRYREMNNDVFGRFLAERIARKLKANPGESGGIYFAHKDYCGLGLYLEEGRFVLGVVNDGRGPFPTIASFESENEFVEWLGEQSNQSMALYGAAFNNQTITRVRLEWYLEADYDPTWNAYCMYIRGREPEV